MEGQKAVDMIPQLENAQNALKAKDFKNQAETVRLAIKELESIKPPWWQICLNWIYDNPWISLLAALYLLWGIVCFIIFFINPLKLIPINEKLKGLAVKPKWAGGLAISLRHLFFVGFLYARPRVLDAWIKAHLVTVRDSFKGIDTVEDRKIHISVPVEIDKKTVSDLKPVNLKPVFARPPACLLIWGEGGAGKTSLACQIAKWAMSEARSDRISQHLMLPVLIEEELDADVENAFTGAIKRQLQILTIEPEPASDELLKHLLIKQRILVIVDHLSEMSASTRDQIKPGQSDFLANALIVTSRLKEKDKLGYAKRSSAKAGKIPALAE